MKPLEDTQNEKENRNIAIHRVGIRSLRHPVTLTDRDGSQPTIATMALSVHLPGSQRGTHMSRFVSIVRDFAPDLSVKKIRKLAEAVNSGLESDETTIALEMPFFRDKAAPVSKSPGFIDYEVELGCSIDSDRVLQSVKVATPVTTLCPCSRNISDRGAHNQRGIVSITAMSVGELPWVADLVEIAEKSASSELYSLLKRPDEKQVTETAYDNPVFVEDLVRNVAERLQKGEARLELSGFRVEAENFESIHNHSAFAIIEEGVTRPDQLS